MEHLARRRRWLPIPTMAIAFAISLAVVRPVQTVAATVSGQAFVDRNCNSIKEVKDQSLSNWKVYLRGQVSGQPLLDSTTTNPDGFYSFSGLAAGNYSLATSQQPEYVQTAPVSVDYRMTLGGSETLNDRDFAFKAVAWCDTIVDVFCPGGVDDNFSGANGSEPSTPSAGLLAAMTACGTPLSFFDQSANGACFGHTYSNCWDTCGVITATVTLRLRASSDGSQDDELSFGDWPEPGAIWHISLSTLLELKTGGADASWDPGDTMTVALDLANLPVAVRGLTNVIAAMQDQDLDILVRNNTEVDYAGAGCGDG